MGDADVDQVRPGLVPGPSGGFPPEDRSLEDPMGLGAGAQDLLTGPSAARMV